MRRNVLLMRQQLNKDTIQLVLLRHGESEWNASKKFSGWVDIDLTEKGVQEVRINCANIYSIFSKNIEAELPIYRRLENICINNHPIDNENGLHKG
jgi:hypothetical protein